MAGLFHVPGSRFQVRVQRSILGSAFQVRFGVRGSVFEVRCSRFEVRKGSANLERNLEHEPGTGNTEPGTLRSPRCCNAGRTPLPTRDIETPCMHHFGRFDPSTMTTPPEF